MSFAKDKEKEIKAAIIKAINNHLVILDSPILFPKKNDKENEAKFLATVKSREKVYNNLISLIDKAGIDRTRDTKLKNNIIRGLKTTFEELLNIVHRPMREIVVIEDEEGYADLETRGTSDDIISSVSDSVKTAADLLVVISERIMMLEDPDALNAAKLENIKIPSIPERYVVKR